MSPWVVTCTGCGCIITCFAVDPQIEHMKPEVSPPQNSAHVTCPCCWKTFRYSGEKIGRGTPRQNPSCSRKNPPSKSSDGALLVAASIVAAIRLRGQDIKPSPKLTILVNESVALARTVLAQIEKS